MIWKNITFAQMAKLLGMRDRWKTSYKTRGFEKLQLIRRDSRVAYTIRVDDGYRAFVVTDPKNVKVIHP